MLVLTIVRRVLSCDAVLIGSELVVGTVRMNRMRATGFEFLYRRVLGHGLSFLANGSQSHLSQGHRHKHHRDERFVRWLCDT